MTFMIQSGPSAALIRTSHRGAERVALNKFRATGLPVTVWEPTRPTSRRPFVWRVFLYTRHV